MSKEEEKPTRVTRGALRRMSVEQEPTSAPGTPKKSTATAVTSKKLAVLDAIQEGSNGPSDAEVDENTAGRESKGKNDTSLAGNRSVHMPKEHEKKATTGRPAVSMLTVENVSKLDSFLDIRRTPRRRPSQDQTLTPQTLPKRVTRRNSVTSDDGNLGAATPKTSRTRHSIAAQAVIAEDDEKEEQTGNVSSTAEADLSDLDIRKLRNRSISKSPVPGKNTSAVSIKEGDVAATSPVKAGGEPSSSQKPEKAPVSQEDKMEESESFVDVVTVTPAKSDSAISVSSSQVSEQQQQQSQKTPAMVAAAAAAVKDVKFDEGTPDQLNKSKYPKTPVAVAAGGKRRKLSELAAEAAADEDESLTTDSEIIIVDETIKDSPQVVEQKPETPKTPTKASASPKKEATKLIIIDETIKDSPRKSSQEAASPKTPSKANGTPKKTTPKKSQDEASEESPDKSIDASIANIVEQVREEMNQSADLSMSILGTPKPTTGGKHKSHFSHLREGSSSTPIAAKHAALGEIPEEDPKEDASMGSKSWSQAVKGSGQDKGIDVFSVRKKEEEEKQEEETKTLNESLKRKSLEKMQPLKVDEDEEEGEEEEDEDEIDASQKRSSFVDDEAMEVNGYQSGDSMDSETRAEIEDNQVEDDGESIGSQDTEEDEEDGDDDSFIASDGEEVEDLLAGTGDELHSEEEADKSSKKNKKRKRILLQEDSSEDEKETSKAEKTLNETAASENKSPKKGDASNVSKTGSPRKTPLKTVEAKSPKKTPAVKAVDKEEQEESAEHSEDPQTDNAVAESPRSAKKTPSKASLSTDLPEQHKSAKKNTTEVSESPKSPKKTPSKPSLESETQQVKSAEKRRSSKTSESENVSEVSKSRKSLPAPALISADFYSSSAKKAKRNTIDIPAAAGEEELEQATPKEEVNSNLVTNPAALALAKKNRRLSQGLSPATKQDKRASLPGKLPDESEVGSPLKKKSNKKQADSVEKANDSVEPMEVDEDEEEEVAEKQPTPKKPAVVAKKKPRDLSDFDTEAILSRCNEIVRADKEKRKEGATLRQKKKDEKRRQREQEQQEDAADGEANDESTEQQKKKKKKKKKQVNYLLEELGETKEDQVARALQRKMALLEAKRERKKAKKAAKLREQLNKENQQEGQQTTSVKASKGIAAKLEKQTKKTKKMEKEVKKAILEDLRPVVRLAVSAFAMYSEQIEDMKKEKADKKKPKSKQLKEKNQQPTAVEEVQAALQAKPDAKPKKDKVPKQKQASADQVQLPVEHPKADKKKEVVEEPVKEEPAAVKHKKKEKLTAVKSDELPPKKKHHEQINTAPLKSVVSLDDELAQLKKSLSEPVAKVVKKQKLSHKESSIATVTAREVTPPRKATTGKLKALARLEAGFQEEPITPDHKLLKRNHGFKEEPVTPKSVGFKVSSVLPAGQEALKQEAVEAKRKKTYHNTNRIRPEDVREPARGLPLPVWTRSGTFEVEELEETKSRKVAKGGSDYVPLNVNGGNSATEFLVKPLGGKSKHSGESKTSTGGGISKVHRIDADTVDEAVINFKKQAIFGKNAHLREKKRKH
ncbi:protein slender lobes [Aedes albopictus]|uniref:Uncharacterized protein n=1 Tax=Aedes albopictus TaxID=7160 RepID=A0ABM1ZJC3_AEDAL|nr:protein slender lobes [Aedes albopictus]